jgi:hypothetical protein
VKREHVAIGIVLVGIIAAVLSGRPSVPTPAPPAPGELVLRGLFVGPTAADDAAVFAGITGELAAVLEYDGGLPGGPRITTGEQLQQLRSAARDARMAGVSLGARQPAVRDAIGAFLDAKAGNDPGALSPAARSAWVSAFREVSRAAEAAVK